MTHKENVMAYWLKTVPLTIADMINRKGTQLLSPGAALGATGADYNGHHVGVGYRDMAIGGGRWTAEYTWCGRNVIGRGSLNECLLAAKYEYDRGAHGAVVIVGLSDLAPESIEEQRTACEKLGFEPYTKEIAEEHNKMAIPSREAVWAEMDKMGLGLRLR